MPKRVVLYGLNGRPVETMIPPENKPLKRREIDPARLALAEAAVALVDVGGTKTRVLLVGLTKDGGLLSDVVLSEREFPTPVGKKDGFFDTMAREISALRESYRGKAKLLPFVAYGTPGRLVSGIIQPGSAGNLGDTRSEFDGVKPAEELGRRISLPVYTGNDAVAQMGYGLSILLANEKTRAELLGKKVAYIGPGTGLGGGFGRVREDGSVEFHTDGHIYDIMVPGLEKDVTVPLIVGGELIKLPLPHKRPMAEDLLSGRAVGEIMRALDRRMLREGKPPVFLPYVPGFLSMSDAEIKEALAHENNDSFVSARLLNEGVLSQADSATASRSLSAAEGIAEFEGLVLGRLASCIHAGKIKKLLDSSDWPAEDRQKVAGTERVIVGGTVITKGPFGELVRKKAGELLRGRGDFKFYPITGETADAGTLGAFMFIPADVLKKEIARER